MIFPPSCYGTDARAQPSPCCWRRHVMERMRWLSRHHAANDVMLWNGCWGSAATKLLTTSCYGTDARAQRSPWMLLTAYTRVLGVESASEPHQGLVTRDGQEMPRCPVTLCAEVTECKCMVEYPFTTVTHTAHTALKWDNQVIQ